MEFQGIRNSSVAVAVVFLTAASAVMAQSTGASEEELNEVVVTGSRVIANGNDSPTPVTVMSMEQLLAASPVYVSEAINMLPAFSGTARRGGPAVLNLRGIGAQRVLIMFDGHRLAATNAGAGVDTNLVPSMLLKRVDIVTGGTSAVYGSDAVSGVVNYITDNNFNGFKATAQGGVSVFNDDRTYSFGVAGGMPLFDGRGHIEFSYRNGNDPGIPSRYSRGFGRALWSVQGSVVGAPNAGSVTNPYVLVSNSRLNNTNAAGVINTGPLANLQFAQNGVLSPFARGTPTGNTGVDLGGDGGYYTGVTLIAGNNSDQVFGRFDYDFTNTVKGYVEISATTELNWTNGTNSEVRTRTVGYNNAFLNTIQSNYRALLPTALQSGTNNTQLGLINAAGSFNYSRIFEQNEFPPPRTETRADQFLFISGLEGSWGKYKWDLGYERSNAVTTQTQPNSLSNSRLYAAMNAVVNPANGQVVCNAALIDPADFGNCVPLNLFGPTASNRASFDYIRNNYRNAVTYHMDDLNASVTGAPFSTWVGPVEMALSAEYRKLTYKVVSNATPSDPINCTGIQFNCVSTGTSATAPYSASTANFPTVKQTVSEFGYEAQVPLLKDQFLAKSVGLNAAARYTNYSTSGVVWSWKAGLTWTMNDALTLRVARSRDIRAPTLQNLFAPQTYASLVVSDLHTNLTGTLFQVTQGNPTLTPELADTWTAGFVWTPQFVQGLSMTLDGYRIKIKNGLVTLSVATPAVQVACESSNGTSPICSLFNRPLPFSDRSAANFPISVFNQNLNTAGFLTYGIDAEIDYSRSIAGHALQVRALANYQPHLIYDYGPGGVTDVGGAADGIAGLMAVPNVKALLQVNFDVTHNLTATVQERWRNALKQNGSPVLFFVTGEVPPMWYTDLTLNYKLSKDGHFETFLNVRNLLNQSAPPWSSSGGTGQIGVGGGMVEGDDPIGRYYTLGVRLKL
jgi:outer membrane receptor protein involved in Fe transport